MFNYGLAILPSQIGNNIDLIKGHTKELIDKCTYIHFDQFGGQAPGKLILKDQKAGIGCTWGYRFETRCSDATEDIPQGGVDATMALMIDFQAMERHAIIQANQNWRGHITKVKYVPSIHLGDTQASYVHRMQEHACVPYGFITSEGWYPQPEHLHHGEITSAWYEWKQEFQTYWETIDPYSWVVLFNYEPITPVKDDIL